MRGTIRIVCLCTLLTIPRLSAWSQEEARPFHLVELQADVAEQILNVHTGPMTPLVDHLWKSNGGALLPRNAQNDDARAFAANLAQSIAYDAEARTLHWPVYGFHDPLSERFTPGLMWGVLEPYFQGLQISNDEMLDWRGNFMAAQAARPVMVDPLAPPAGLTRPARELLHITGYYGTALFVYSADNCFEVAEKCYRLGLLNDARVLLSHAIAQSPRAKFYYLRGTIEMRAGIPDDAMMSAVGYIAATAPPTIVTPSYVYERVNGPPAIQFRHLVAELLRRR